MTSSRLTTANIMAENPGQARSGIGDFLWRGVRPVIPAGVRCPAWVRRDFLGSASVT